MALVINDTACPYCIKLKFPIVVFFHLYLIFMYPQKYKKCRSYEEKTILK